MASDLTTFSHLNAAPQTPPSVQKMLNIFKLMLEENGFLCAKFGSIECELKFANQHCFEGKGSVRFQGLGVLVR